MVNQTYDVFGRQDKPEITLCNPDKTELYSLYSLSSSSNTIVKLRYNALSELEMVVPKEVGGVEIPAYDFISQKRLIRVEDDDVGYFVIVDVKEKDFGGVPSKSVRALSLEFTLMGKKLSAFGGTLPLYDILTPADSLLGKLLEYIPSWSVGTIDGDLLTKFRTFDVSDTNIYNFMMTDVEEAYGCIFTFDTVNSTISATAIENITDGTDVYISHDNLIQESTFSEIADELTTALYVYGGGDLDIRTVNPLGTNVIYNFSYYMTVDWMTQGLITALDAWDAAILGNQALYANYLSDLKTDLGEKVVLGGELVTLNSEYIALDGVLKAKVEGGLSLTATNALLIAKQVEIDNKEAEITNKESEITSLQALLTGINDSLSFENNFTAAQILELSYFMYENTYQNENLVQLDSMDADDIQDLAQTLYDQAVVILEKISQPRYEYSMDTASMLALQEYSAFSDALQLGSTVYVERENGSVLTLVLLELVFNYDDPSGFSMIFSNRLRLDNGSFVYSDLMGQPVKTGSTVKFDKLKWANWAGYYKDDVTNFITSSLDASVNEVINAANQEIKIYENGLRGREYISPGIYDDRQVWLTSKTLAFTDDNWNTASLAIGEIDFNGTPLWGVVADAIVGKVVAGNQLSIENSNNNFLLDETGAYLTDASFILTRSDGKSRITLDPTVGVKIESNPSGTWNDSFYADTAGNIIFSGTLSGASGNFSGSITATSGSIGGMSITSNGIDVDATHFIHNNGDITWGGLQISGATASFDGTVSASQLLGTVDWSQIENAPIPTSQFNGGTGYSAGGITTGSLSGSRVYGGTIGGNGISIGLSGTGVPTISGTSGATINGGSGFLDIQSGYGYLFNFGSLSLEGYPIKLVTSGLQINGNSGKTIGFTVSVPVSTGRAVLSFVHGLMVNYYYY